VDGLTFLLTQNKQSVVYYFW